MWSCNLKPSSTPQLLDLGGLYRSLGRLCWTPLISAQLGFFFPHHPSYFRVAAPRRFSGSPPFVSLRCSTSGNLRQPGKGKQRHGHDLQHIYILKSLLLLFKPEFKRRIVRGVRGLERSDSCGRHHPANIKVFLREGPFGAKCKFSSGQWSELQPVVAKTPLYLTSTVNLNVPSYTLFCIN